MGTLRTEQAWLDAIRAASLRGDHAATHAELARAMEDFPRSHDLRRIEAGMFQQAGRRDEAKAALRSLLDEAPDDAASAFALARLLRDESRMAGLAAVMGACFNVPHNAADAGLAIAAIELLDDCDRKRDASAIAEAALSMNPDDARLHAYAGMLQIQLGDFEQARQHYLFALEHAERAWEWHVPIGLSSAQRYADREHPDFALFRHGLEREALSDHARAELHFSLGKAHDDVGEYAYAASHFREGNAIKHRLTKWSREMWTGTVGDRRMTGSPEPPLTPHADFAPVFIVGMPRTGTTLLAELLSRYPQVCNRGELPWIAKLAERLALSGHPDRAALQDAAAFYLARSRQDDAGDARWFIDKQPLNFRYIDLMLAMFPHAKIIHCRRNPRDTTLSLWMQCFLEDVQGYSYDFDDIALVMRDCARLMVHWQRLFPASIRAVDYETLVSNPDGVITELAEWIGLPPPPTRSASPITPPAAISTASLWQARQPVHSDSIGRWRKYARYVSELSRFPGREEAD